jgi:hypothetical protein
MTRLKPGRVYPSTPTFSLCIGKNLILKEELHTRAKFEEL